MTSNRIFLNSVLIEVISKNIFCIVLRFCTSAEEALFSYRFGDES
jgi:hypothetical protein